MRGSIPKNEMEIFNGIFREGGGRGSRVPLRFFHLFLLKNHLEALPYCQNTFCTQFKLSFMYICIVVEVTLNWAEYGSGRASLRMSTLNQLYEDLKSDIFD